VKYCIVFVLLGLWSTGCKQGLGERCQINADCASDHCSMSDPQVCVNTEGNTVGDIDATVEDPGFTAFAFQKAQNAGLAADVTATITGTAIAAVVPAGTNVTALIATFASTGTGVAVPTGTASTAQASGVTPNDFTAPVTYRVTLQDGSTQDYTVTVTLASAPAAQASGSG
jgi:trimeric autotransporter adhesin